MFDYTLYYYSNRVQKETGYFLNKTLHNTAVKITILVKKSQKKKTTTTTTKKILKRVLVFVFVKTRTLAKTKKTRGS